MSRSTAAPPPRLLTVAQAAERLDTTTSKLYELVAKRSIPSVRIGRAIRIPQDDLDRLVGSAGEAQSPRHDDHQRTSRVDLGDELEDRSRRDDALGRRNDTEARRPTSATVPMPERSHAAYDPSERGQPDSREPARSDTDLHPRATRRRVDAESPRGARP
jgi:excisionase family DNA binding protein